MGEIYKLKVTLIGCRPPVWREVEIASSMTLAELHDVLQVLMGWDDCHLWAFEFGKRRFELPDLFDLKAVNKAFSALGVPRRPH